MKVVRIISYFLYFAAAVMIVLDNTAVKGKLTPAWAITIAVASAILLTGVIVQIARRKY